MKITAFDPEHPYRLGTGTTLGSSAGGDLSGSLPAPTVSGLQGTSVTSNLPANVGDVLTISQVSPPQAIWATPSNSGSSSLVFNVADYGALGDGSNDDTAEIQAAIDACMTAGGGVVWFPDPSAYYKVSATLDIDPGSSSSPIRLVGAGAGQYVNGPTIRMVTTNTTLFRVTTNATGTVFEHLFLYQATGSQSSGDGIDADNDVYLTDVQINGFYNGLHINSISYYAKHVNCTFAAAAGSGVLMDAGANNADFYGCKFQTSGYGINAAGALKVGIHGGSVEANTTAGIRANGGSSNGAGLLVSGVYFEQSDGVPDMLLGDSSVVYAVTVTGCAFIKSAFSGTGWHIDGQNVTGLTVIGNEFNSSEAVRATGSSANVTLVGNRNRNSGTYTLPASAVVIESGVVTVSELAAPGTPPTGFVRLYAKSDGKLYRKDDAGTEAELGGSTSPLTSKGDLYTYDTTNARLAVGSNGTGLIADSTATAGIRWTIQALAGELLMADGVTAPPVPIENELQNDWLYADL